LFIENISLKTTLLKMTDSDEKQKTANPYVGIVITCLVFTCKDCNFSFYTTVPGLVRQFLGRLILSKRGCNDTFYQPSPCPSCGSGNAELFKCLE